MNKILKDEIQKIFQFKFNYTKSAAMQQAEKLKVDAFGKLAQFKFWGGKPNEENISVMEPILKYEPFWVCEAERICECNKSETYIVTPKSTWSTSVFIGGVEHIVPLVKKIEIKGVENIRQVEQFKKYFSGKVANKEYEKKLEMYLEKFRSSLIKIKNPNKNLNYVRPEPTKSFVEQTVVSKLSVPIHADEILSDICEFKRFDLYYRPVYQFECKWEDKVGLIEIDGLTGDPIVKSNSRITPFEKLTREDLFDIAGEIAGALVPGGAVAVKIIDKITEK